MKNLILLLSVLFLTSCKTNEILFVVNVGNDEVEYVEQVVCLNYTPGDTAVVYPYELYKFVDYGEFNDTLLNAYDTLVYPDFTRSYCPTP